MIRFAAPVAFALVLLPAARLFLAVRDRDARFGAFRFSSIALAGVRTSLRSFFSFLPFVLEIAAMLLLVIALGRPQRVTRAAVSDRYGIDIVVALDSSGSMAAEDFRPRNRFAVAKDLVGDFVERRVDDRIGIITFGVRAVTRVPITFDREIARAILDKAEVGENGNGTAIGLAIATAVNRLKSSKSRTRVIILVTDGVNNSGAIDPVVAASLAAQFGIKIYAIGVGSEGTVQLPVKRQNPFTGEIEIIYQQIRGEIDDKTLAAITGATGGEYFRATDPRAMSAVLEKIDRLEKSRLTPPRVEIIEELYAWPLAAAFFCFLLSLIAGETLFMKVTA